MNYYVIDPLADSRWDSFVDQHPASSIFHTSGWLNALKQTYRFEPAAITTTPPGQALSNSIVFCNIRSWLTGRRMVSLPFSDHCEPLVSDVEELDPLLEGLRRMKTDERWDYFELRPLTRIESIGFDSSKRYCFHNLDLRPELEGLSSAFHKDCVLRKIRRAERDGVSCEEGRSEELLDKFYALQLQTRRRHEIPPQPHRWFKNLMQSLGERLTIWVASYVGKPISSLIMIKHRKTIFYKYGCSDERFSAHGGTQLLFWRVIKQAKAMGLDNLDLGRSDCDNQGLISFKNRLGSAMSEFKYLRFPAPITFPQKHWKFVLAKKIWQKGNKLSLAWMGTLFYRHFA
jgi:hypothetical protein